MQVQFISVIVFSAQAGAVAAEILLMIYFDMIYFDNEV
jgi:hypothetical protein